MTDQKTNLPEEINVVFSGDDIDFAATGRGATYRRADLAPMVKPLEWYDSPDDDTDFCADALGLTYCVYVDIDGVACWGFFRAVGGFTVDNERGDIEAAKAAAQADYERRILSALTVETEVTISYELFAEMQDAIKRRKVTTMTSKHTEGPWTWQQDQYGIRLAPGILLPGTPDGTPFGDNIDKANARLIAATPELLEALEECLKKMLDFAHDSYDGVWLESDFDDMAKPFRDVIAKARGNDNE